VQNIVSFIGLFCKRDLWFGYNPALTRIIRFFVKTGLYPIIWHLGQGCTFHVGLRLAGSLQLQVSFAEYSLFYKALLQKESPTHAYTHEKALSPERSCACMRVYGPLFAKEPYKRDYILQKRPVIYALSRESFLVGVCTRRALLNDSCEWFMQETGLIWTISACTHIYICELWHLVTE